MTRILSISDLTPPLSPEKQVELAVSRFITLAMRDLRKRWADQRYHEKRKRAA